MMTGRLVFGYGALYHNGMSTFKAEHAGDLRRDLAYRNLYTPRPAHIVASDHHRLYHQAAAVMGSDEPVTYLEFGVASGNSMRRMVTEFTHPDSVFVGFDSFVGLPEDWLMHKTGAFSNHGVPPDIGDSRVRFVTGWFQNTLHENLAWIDPFLKRKVLIHYDADLYTSTSFLLSSMWPRCNEYYFIMDDFMVEDIVALHDFSLAYPVNIAFLARLEGGVPHAVFGHMKRTALVI